MTKIAVNKCYGGFGLSDAAESRLRELGCVFEYSWDIARDDPLLVKVIEELGDAAGGSYANIKIVTIPDDVEWVIEEYDGSEWVSEKHRTW